MRRIVLTCAAMTALLLAGASPTAANAAPPATTTATSGSGWVPAPTQPFDRAAGVLCDFAVHAEPIVDEVVTRVLATNPDGSTRRAAFKGDLVVRVTNTSTGGYFDADASGSAIVDYHADGSMTWYVLGPVLVGIRDGGGNLPRGLYVISGIYRMDISADGVKTITMVTGTADNVCTRID